jgi:chromatin segregation and condensation protein Rec8/ScpA/Scc1 (kleisin family)
MLGLRLVHLIEAHSEELAQGLTRQLRESERTREFRKIAPEELQRAVVEVYRNLGEWLLQKSEADIGERFRAIAARRASQGVPLSQFVWALVISRNHLWHFLQREAFADNIVELFGELELQKMFDQFFDRAVYFATLGYEETEEREIKRTGDKERLVARAAQLA